MNKFSRPATLILLIVFLVCISHSQQNDPLYNADQLFAAHEFTKAIEAYQELLGKTSDVPTKSRILLNLGKTYRMLKQYDLSIDKFKLAAEIQTREAASTNQRLQFPVKSFPAGIEISKSLFAKGDYTDALSTFRAAIGTGKVSTGCGTCNESIKRERNITEGIYLESLGKYNEAVIAYLKADEPHLVELYFKTGQLEDLREFVERDVAELMRKNSWRQDYARENSRYRNLIMMINAYDLEKQRNWPKLIQLLVLYDTSPDFGRSNIPATILARHADEIIPLLQTEITKFTLARQISVIYDVLARSGTEKSIALLNDLSEKHGLRVESCLILGKIYRRSGEKERNRLNRVKSLVQPWAEFYFERDDVDEFGRFEIKFPHTKSVTKLPQSSEILL